MAIDDISPKYFSNQIGFSSGNKTWLPVANDYAENNVRLQESQRFSHLNVYKQILRLRRLPALRDGDYTSFTLDKDILVYKREIITDPRAGIVVVALNFGQSPKTIDLTAVFRNLPKRLEVGTASIHSQLIEGDIVDSNRIEVYGDVGVVLRSI